MTDDWLGRPPLPEWDTPPVDNGGIPVPLGPLSKREADTLWRFWDTRPFTGDGEATP